MGEIDYNRGQNSGTLGCCTVIKVSSKKCPGLRLARLLMKRAGIGEVLLTDWSRITEFGLLQPGRWRVK